MILIDDGGSWGGNQPGIVLLSQRNWRVKETLINYVAIHYLFIKVTMVCFVYNLSVRKLKEGSLCQEDLWRQVTIKCLDPIAI